MTQESPTLDLAIDCFHFVTGHFDAINLSSPHIYHSALVLAPKKSIIWGLYEAHAQPLVGIVQGAPMSWDTSAAATTRSSTIDQAVWSPCNRFIAIVWQDGRTVDVLDPVTLQLLQTHELQMVTYFPFNLLIFSPDSHILTYSRPFDDGPELLVVSWDLQTGGTISTIEHPGLDEQRPTYFPPSITYSANGKMVGVLYGWDLEGTVTYKIFIFDVVSGIHMHSHLLDSDRRPLRDIWTQGEFLLFATFFDATTTVIQKVRFTSGTTPVEIKRLSAPIHNIGHLTYVQPIPTNPSQFLLVSHDGVLIWDSQTSKTLLSCMDSGSCNMPTFSSDGHFFACQIKGSEIHLWKESPTGYIIQEILVPHTALSKPLLSPNGESIVVFGGQTMWLWQTKGFTTVPSRISTQATPHTEDFLLNFSPDVALAVVARKEDNTVMVLNLNSGVSWLIIDVGMGAYGLQVTKHTVLVVGSSNVVAWKLPTSDLIPNIRMGVEDNLWTTNLDDLPLGEHNYVCGASISPDSCHIAIIVETYDPGDTFLSVHSMFTGVCLMRTTLVWGSTPWFSPDGCNIWCVSYSGDIDDKYMLGAGHGLHKVYSDPRHAAEELLWASSCGYQVTSDWWVLDPDGKRLLMLPPPWQSCAAQQAWKGRFLVLLHRELSEPVILELGVKQ